MSDLLMMDRINSLPQPIIVCFYGGSEWPLYDIDVQTGLMRVDVIGKTEVTHFRDVKLLRDADGVEHDADSFYTEDMP